jgi:hypothetical protein
MKKINKTDIVIKTGHQFLITQIVECSSKLIVKTVGKDGSLLDGVIKHIYISYRKDADKRPSDIRYVKSCAALCAGPDFGEVTVFNCLCQLPEIRNKKLTQWLKDFKDGPKTDYHKNLVELIDCGYLGSCAKHQEELHTIWRGDRALLKKITALLKQRGERYTQEPPVPNERSDE